MQKVILVFPDAIDQFPIEQNMIQAEVSSWQQALFAERPEEAIARAFTKYGASLTKNFFFNP